MKFIYLLKTNYMGIINISDMEGEKQKTMEELVAENKQLTEQLTNFSDKVKNLGSILVDGKEQNVKLTYAIRLFAETHLTREEKLSIAQEFDRAASAEQVERIYKKYIEQICPSGVDIEPDFLWSPGFSRDLEKYYFQYKGYNPFEVIDSAAKIIRLQFKIEEELSTESNPTKISSLKESWETNRMSALSAVDEIITVTNEILRK